MAKLNAPIIEGDDKVVSIAKLVEKEEDPDATPKEEDSDTTPRV